jgi:hypothetical protein
MSEEVLALVGREAVEYGADPVPECWDGTLRSGAQMGFEFGEGLLDRIEVGRVWRQIEKLRSCGLDDLAYHVALVGGQIVHHYDVAALQCRHEALFEIAAEDCAIHWFVDHEGRGHGVMSKAGDKGRDLPMTVRDFGDQALPTFGAASEPGHVGAGTGLINEDQTCGVKQRLIGFPEHAGGGYVGAILLAGVCGFF